MKRIRNLMNKTSWGWIVALAMVPAVLAGCDTAAENRTAQLRPQAADPVLYQDRTTGCEYLSTGQFNALVPRIAADGKAHMGCREVRP